MSPGEEVKITIPYLIEALNFLVKAMPLNEDVGSFTSYIKIRVELDKNKYNFSATDLKRLHHFNIVLPDDRQLHLSPGMYLISRREFFKQEEYILRFKGEPAPGFPHVRHLISPDEKAKVIGEGNFNINQLLKFIYMAYDKKIINCRYIFDLYFSGGNISEKSIPWRVEIFESYVLLTHFRRKDSEYKVAIILEDDFGYIKGGELGMDWDVDKFGW